MTMCFKDRTSRTRTMIKKKNSKKARKPARRCRTKTRKPKFLSLISLEISSEKAQQSSDMPSSTSTDTKDQQQLYLFPLHPENLVEDKDNHDENMAYLFSAADGSASTLTGLLGAATASSSGEDDKNGQCAELSHSASLSYSYEGEVKQAVALARTALKNKERDSTEERYRYVRYSEVVERRDEEVSSSAADIRYGNRNLMMMKVENQRLSLKLDYEEILNAWSDKGSLYVYADSPPQTVPDIHDDFLPHDLSNGEVSNHGWRNYEGLWKVPELASSSLNVNEIKAEEEQQQQAVGVGVGVGVGAGLEEWKLGQREASVLRYKEKRQNRLFSKRIRYQVRKLNAEKRPRVKGRFVKRS